MTDSSLRNAGEEQTLAAQTLVAPSDAEPDVRSDAQSSARINENPAAEAEVQATDATEEQDAPAGSNAETCAPEADAPGVCPQDACPPEEHDGVFTLCDLVEQPEPSSPERTLPTKALREEALSETPPEQAASDQNASDQTLPDQAPAEPWPGAAGNPPAPPVPPQAGGGDGAQDGDAPKDEPEKTMTLLDHLGELRSRLVRGFVAVLIAFFGCYGFAKELFHALSQPLLAVMPADAKFIYTGVAEGFFVDLKVGFVAALFVASPYLFYQIWAFVAPGLYEEEKRYAIPLALCSAVFFIGGAAFCYLVVFPFAFTFFLSYSTESIVAMLSISEYLSFALKMLIAFGLIFEMPLFAFFLARMGLITAQKMRRARKYAVLGVFIVAAILTPPDVFSQILMACPMLLLYEISILVAAVAGRKKEKTHEPES